MNRRLILRCFTGLIAILFVSSCVATRPEKPMPSFSSTNFNTKSYASKVDSFIILFDASSSMLDYYNGNKKFTIAKAVATRMNQTIPQLGQNAGFRSFGHDPSVSKNNTELFYGIKNYSTAGFAKGIDKVTAPGGVSPLYKALQAAEKDLENSSGKKAIIIISDGQKTDMVVPNTLDYAQRLKDKFGSSLCIYTIVAGGSPEGVKFMNDLSKIAECGFSTNANNLLASSAMADFVEKVFLTRKSKSKPKPKKAKPVKKVRKDSDHDGIFDDNDLCPNTPIGAKVNIKGCWSFGDALFDTNKADIKQNAYTLLNHAHIIFTKNPGMNVILKGHTDNYGTDQYNMDLSLRRAKAVKAYLVNKGIDSSRLTCQAYGESSPIATNDSKEGRSLNRRVELAPEK